MKSSSFSLVYICVSLLFLNVVSIDLPKPKIHYAEQYDGLKIVWDLPFNPTENVTLDYFQVFWKLETDSMYEVNKTIPSNTTFKEDNPGPSSPSASYYGVILTYDGDNLRPCSTYKVRVQAAFSDSSMTNNTILTQTKIYTGAFLDKFTINPIPNLSIEMEIKPTEDYISFCKIPEPSYTFKVRGFSQWNDIKEIIPEFSTRENKLALTGLYPYTMYNIEIKAEGSELTDKFSAVTFPSVPGEVTDVQVECNSQQSISVSWSTILEANGLISHYWIEVIDLYKGLRELHRVDPEFTKANLQKITPNTEYHVVVWAENKAGNGKTSDTVPVTLSCKI